MNCISSIERAQIEPRIGRGNRIALNIPISRLAKNLATELPANLGHARSDFRDKIFGNLDCRGLASTPPRKIDSALLFLLSPSRKRNYEYCDLQGRQCTSPERDLPKIKECPKSCILTGVSFLARAVLFNSQRCNGADRAALGIKNNLKPICDAL